MTKDKEKQQTTENQDINQQQEANQASQEPNCDTQENDKMADQVTQDDDKAEKMAEQTVDWQDKYMRLSAEFDNYRKRTLKEKMDLIATASEDVIKSMLSVVDDMDRAILAMDTASDVDSIKEGIKLIHTKLNDTLKAKGLSELPSIGEVLDTDNHEAIAIVPVGEEDKKGKIIDVVQKGYKLKEKVIRHAKVVVGE